MRIFSVLLLTALTTILSVSPSAAITDRDAAGTVSSEGDASSALIPPYVAAYPNAGAIPWGDAADLEWRASIDAPNASAWADDEGSSGSVKRYAPVLLSLLIPGTGEIALGYPKRGIALIALEVVAWSGYAYYNNKGLDGREEFENFADAHWDFDRFVVDHPAVAFMPPSMRTFEALDSIGVCCWTGWPGYHSFSPAEELKLNYYEMIGKYDWFISGWEDWDQISMDTSLRTEYRSLRQQSNSDLDTADRFIYLSVATRVFSVVETIILANRSGKSSSKDSNGDESSKKNFSFTSRATGIASGEFALVYRF